MANVFGIDVRNGCVARLSTTSLSEHAIAWVRTDEFFATAVASLVSGNGEDLLVLCVGDEDRERGLRCRAELEASGLSRILAVDRTKAVRLAPALPLEESAAVGAARWALERERASVAVPPAIPSHDEARRNRSSRIADYGRGRSMAAFGTGSAMARFRRRRRRTTHMDDYGQGVSMADFEQREPTRSGRGRVVVSVSLGVVVVAAAAASVGALVSNSDGRRDADVLSAVSEQSPPTTPTTAEVVTTTTTTTAPPPQAAPTTVTTVGPPPTTTPPTTAPASVPVEQSWPAGPRDFVLTLVNCTAPPEGSTTGQCDIAGTMFVPESLPTLGIDIGSMPGYSYSGFTQPLGGVEAGTRSFEFTIPQPFASQSGVCMWAKGADDLGRLTAPSNAICADIVDYQVQKLYAAPTN